MIDPRAATWPAWRPQRLKVAGLLAYLGLLTALFVQPLATLMGHAIADELHSHIPLVPFVAGYLLYIRPKPLTSGVRISIPGAAMFAACGVAALAGASLWRETLSVNDYLAVTTTAYLCLATAGGFLFLGGTWMASAAFPLAFLAFMIPLPDVAVHWLERASVLASSEAAALFFRASGTPLLRDGPLFALPGIVLHVAEECSGIRSTWALFITSVLASHLFLNSPWRRVLLVAFVIPLGIVRNGFRILVIGLLCVHIGPHMIDSIVHHRGGPIFFVLSLVPLFALLLWLRRRDRRRERVL